MTFRVPIYTHSICLLSRSREYTQIMSTSSVEQMLEQLESLTKSPPQDKILQQRLYDAAKKLSAAVEAPLDTVYRVIYSVR